MRLEDILTQIAPAEQRAMAEAKRPVGCRRSPAEQPGHVGDGCHPDRRNDRKP